MITAERKESLGTDVRGWECAYDEEQPPHVAVSESRDTTCADSSVSDEELAQFLKEVRFREEAVSLMRVESEALRNQVRAYVKDCAEQFLMRAPTTIQNAIAHDSISSMEGFGSADEVSQTLYALTSALAYARTALMDTIEGFDAWLYLRRLDEPKGFRFEVPERFVTIKKPSMEEWPDTEHIGARETARERLN